MEIVAFLAFAALVCAWLFAPSGEPKATPEVTPATFQVGAAAD